MTGCGPSDIYQALLNAGASTVQAIGIMANGIAESELNSQAAARDTNGYWSYGLFQWNAESYPNASSLVTGNCAADIKSQVNYLAQIGGINAASGTTPAEAAGNFANSFERCAACDPGGVSYDQRVANAATVAGWVSSGKWPASKGSVTQATLTSKTGSTGTGNPQACLWQLSVGPVNGCVLSKSEARAMVGGALMIAGALLVLPGVLILTAFAFRGAGAAAVGQSAAVLERAPGYGQAIRYARTRSQNQAARGRGTRAQPLQRPGMAGQPPGGRRAIAALCGPRRGRKQESPRPLRGREPGDFLPSRGDLPSC